MEGTGRHMLSWAWITAMLVFIYLPVVVLVMFSFQSGALPVPPLDGPSLRWYERALGNDRLVAALWNSLIVGLGSSAVATLLAAFAAYGLFRTRLRMTKNLVVLLMTPLMVSYLIIGLGLLIVFNVAGFGRSLWAVGIGHVIINLPLCFALLHSQLGDHFRTIDNAAHDLGAGDLATMRRVIGPMMLPSILAVFCLSFTLSWDEFIIAMLLSRFDVTLPVMIFELMRAGLTPEVNAAGTIVFAISFLAALAASAAVFLRAGGTR